ncbi:MAG: cytochrome c oxidase assembly protein [Gammaproteobacteria bacterium]|nr:cytochrome c oxidase assembly protein [Gammaproteobacteria bacterium]
MNEAANRRLALKLAGIALGMFGFGYALVPFYELVCEYTGLGGRTGVISEADAAAEGVDPDRRVNVEFDTNVNGTLPWKFASVQRRISVHPGALTEVNFVAQNTSTRQIVGQAVPSVTPAKAAPYFNKTECFCFTQQTLAPGERREMPVRFVVGPDLPAGVSTVTLSYTFFEAPGPTVGIESAAAGEDSG